MEIKIKLVGFDYASEDFMEEVKRNLYYLFHTPAGSCAGDRNYGIDSSIADKPLDVAMNMLALEIYEKTEEYEPRVSILDISSAVNVQSGQIVTLVTVGINDSYEEPEDDGEEELYDAETTDDSEEA